MRGVQLMAARDYESAASYFGLAERRGLRTPPPRPMTAHALCLANSIDMSKKIVDSLQPRDEDERHFVEWIGMNCS